MTANDNEGMEMESIDSRIMEADCFFDKHEYRRAFDIYLECSRSGDKHSLCRMGMMYAKGLGVDRRPIRAYELIKESYDMNDYESVFQYAKCLFEGIGTDINKELGFELIATLADDGYPPAETYKARLHIEGGYLDKDVDKGLSCLKKAVSKGFPEAQYIMGRFYYEGEYVDIDPEKGLDMWKEAADHNCPPAARDLGYALLKGWGIEKDVTSGLKYLKRASLQGDGIASEYIGDYFMDNRKDLEDVKKAVEYFNMALKNGNIHAYFPLGVIHSHELEFRDYGKACDYFKEGHKCGIDRCSFEYAMMKADGKGTKVDDELAFSIFLELAKRGNIPSMGWVGYYYRKGIGVNPDNQAAREWFTRGYEKDDAYCTFKLAEMYHLGITVRPDEEKAIKLLKISFTNGYGYAAYKLGQIYEDESEVRSVPDAIFWFMQGAKEGNPECMLELARHYESGEYIERSEKKAFGLYRKAFDTDGSLIAAAEVGKCYEEGIGTDKDSRKAMDWYLKAVKKNSFAMWRLYNIYSEKGDVDRAVFWLRRSAAKGSVSAMVELARKYEEGTSIPKSDLQAMRWYHRASEENNEFAKSRFQELIRNDPQDPADIDEVERIKRRIGEDFDDDAIIDLANSLMNGDDTPVDLPKAKMWLETAKQLGVEGAEEGLRRIDRKTDNKYILDDPDGLW